MSTNSKFHSYSSELSIFLIECGTQSVLQNIRHKYSTEIIIIIIIIKKTDYEISEYRLERMTSVNKTTTAL